MQIIKLQKSKKLAFPDTCPVCEKPGKLERFPVGSLMDVHEGRKMHIPMHKMCWRKSNNMAFTFTTIFYAIFAIAIYTYPFNIYYLPGGLLGLLIYFALKRVFPAPIEIERKEEYIQLLILNERYAEKFKELNEEIKYNV